jgi:hypothetical protein
VVPATQISCGPLNNPVEGGVVTVIIRVADTSAHPPVPITVYVIVEVPAAIPATAPVVASIVATVVVEELQVPPLTVELRVVVPAIQMSCVPLNTPAVGGAVTVTVLVAETSEQPPIPVTVYVIVAIPAAIPVTSPLVASTVAIVLAELDHAPPETVELNVVDPKIQISCIPSSVPATGLAVTVIVPVAFTLPQPPVRGIL